MVVEHIGASLLIQTWYPLMMVEGHIDDSFLSEEFDILFYTERLFFALM